MRVNWFFSGSTSMWSIFWSLFRLKPLYFAKVSFLFFIENILEGFGLTLVVPIFYKVFGEAKGATSFSWIDDFFDVIGIGQTIEVLLLFMIGLFLIRAVIMYFSKRYIANSSANILSELQEKLVHNYLQSNLVFFQNNKQGELINSIVTEANRASLSFLYLSQWISFSCSALLYASLALYVSGTLTATALFIGFIFFFPLRIITRECERIGTLTTSLNGELQSDLSESFSLIKFIKAANYEKFIEGRVVQKVISYKNNWAQTYFLSGAIQIFSNPIGIVILCTILYVGFQLKIASPDLIVFLVAFQRLLPSYTSLEGIKNNLYVSYPGLNRVWAFMDTSQKSIERPDGDSVGPFSKLEMESVVFGYNSERKVLSGLSLEIEKGQVTALVGLSGQGKTTLVDLLIGFYSIESGVFRVNGKSFSDISLSSWRSKISYVTQDTLLFHDTVRNNILFGQCNVSEQELAQTILLCHAEFIYELDQGLDCVVGDRGSKLSGGQRQRIALVRALVRRPEILILDEATSSLDTESELMIKSTLEILKNLRQVTVILIAHRLETVKVADQILVIDQGKVLEKGSWDELAQNAETFFYRKLVMSH